MNRPHRASLNQLLCAATTSSSDLDLDRALCDIGVLPPADLDDIRAVLCRDRTELALTSNTDGHAIVQVVCDGQLTALVHHDGRVHVMSCAAA